MNKSQKQCSEIHDKESHDYNPLDEYDNNQSQDESERNSHQDHEKCLILSRNPMKKKLKSPKRAK